MDAVVLHRRAAWHDECVPPDLVDRLLALGHTEVVRGLAVAEDGDWFCARAWARLLDAGGRGEEAITVVRRFERDGERVALRDLALPPARHGQGAEGIEVLRTLGSAEEGLAHLDALKARRGQEERELFRLRGPLMAACGRLDDAVAETMAHPEGGGPYALEWLARLLAEAGRPEEAVALLDTDH
ncbi:hypothetical protein [Streptomyces virginiae]|uniref:hypothetical protein n=1 Tax=Streptomyces virginiae TaxID=1961 RepID=UPI00225211A1|nr:hypothetical protein [Streptomyces virginiae]MCX5177489.1 hypothetical protein [Streptomyces virginiae]